MTLPDPAIPQAAAAASAHRAADICAVVLAAGEGTRLRPLTEAVPKALCPIANVALLDRALARVAGLGLTGPTRVAVNAAYLGHQVVAHVGDRAHLSVEERPLGTSGGVGNLTGWIDGRGALIGNADAYLADPQREPGKDIAALLDGWAGDTVRLLTRPLPPGVEGGFSGTRFAGFSLIPWRYLRDLTVDPSDLVRTVWRPAERAGELEVVTYDGLYLDTGTPADYLAANLHAAGSAGVIAATATVTGSATGSVVGPGAVVTGSATGSVVGPGAVVAGSVTRCVIWPGATVAAGESLNGVIRAGETMTVDGTPRPA